MAQITGSGINYDTAGAWAERDKDSRLDYTFDWTDWLSGDDKIVASDWTAPGLTILQAQQDGPKGTVLIEGGSPGSWYVITNTVLTEGGLKDQRSLRLFIAQDATGSPALSGSALFPNRYAAVAALRSDRLAAAAAGAFPSVVLSDDYLWSKLLAAEAEVARALKVYLQPTVIIPDDAPQDEVDALVAAGVAWAQEPAFDYTTSFFSFGQYGFLQLGNKPLIAVDSIRLSYPSTQNQMFEVPRDWLRMDKRKGTVNIVPNSIGWAQPATTFMLQFLGGTYIPHLIQVRYTAGLVNAAQNWPDLVDVVKKKAVLGMITDAFLPSSGSISADGLSQSMSIDLGQYQDTVNEKLFGPKGSNGGLWTAIHGITMGVA